MENTTAEAHQMFDIVADPTMEETRQQPITTVLIVEDSPIVRERLIEMMEGLKGVAVVGQADTASSAIDEILLKRPDWVLLDLQLIHSSGLDVLRKVRSRVPATGFIVMTNFNTPQYRRICIEAGASHFLDKTQVATVKDIVTGPKFSLRSPGVSQ